MSIECKRGTVTLSLHDAQWRVAAEAIIHRLRDLLGAAACDIQHVGGTALPDGSARPIIDIAVACHNGQLQPCVSLLEQAGYQLQEQGQEQSVLTAGQSDGRMPHCVYLCPFDSMPWRNHMNMREYLTAFPTHAVAYAAHKQALAQAHADDEAAYDAAKAERIAFIQRKAMVWSYLGQEVEIGIDRPIGYVHEKPKYTLVYPINYGYVPDVLGGDGEELDVYVMGIDQPVEQCRVRIVGIVHRENDVEDKLIGIPPQAAIPTVEEMVQMVHFQEQYYRSHVEAWEGDGQ